MTFAKLSAIIYAHLVYAIEVIGALIILAFLLDICMKMWSLLQDRAIANYRVQLRIAALGKTMREMKNRRKNMTINQAIRILDPATTAEELATIEYYGGLHGREKMVAACDEACRMAVQIMRKYMEKQK